MEELAFKGDTVNTDRTNEKLKKRLRLEQNKGGKRTQEREQLPRQTDIIKEASEEKTNRAKVKYHKIICASFYSYRCRMCPIATAWTTEAAHLVWISVMRNPIVQAAAVPRHQELPQSIAVSYKDRHFTILHVLALLYQKSMIQRPKAG